MKKLFFILLLLLATSAHALDPITVTQDGYPTPHQISVFVAGEFLSTDTAAMRYRLSGGEWITGHDLHLIRTDDAESSAWMEDGFAWVIVDLEPGNTYEVEVTVTSGEDEEVDSAEMTTCSLPPAAGTPNKTITTGSSSATIETAFDNLDAGDVIQIENGTYAVDDLDLRSGGTSDHPIYIRGESRTGTILEDTAGTIFWVANGVNHVVLENLTLRGSGIDNGATAASTGIGILSSYVPEGLCFRNLNIEGVDKGINQLGQTKKTLIYNNVILGNNEYDQDLYAWNGSGAPGEGNDDWDIDENQMWNDDGIMSAGLGNAIWNNTIKGFGDAICLNDGVKSVSVHFYKNDIRFAGDDGFEADDATRNITCYDNRITNSATFVSCDPIYGGPFLFFRNIGVNNFRQPYKLQVTESGIFFYNNTSINTFNEDLSTDLSRWVMSVWNLGTFKYVGYQNNIIVHQNNSSGYMLAFEPSTCNPIDFTHNSWYPDGSIYWTNSSPGSASHANLAAAYSGLTATTPVFGGQTQRHYQDNITTSDSPFTYTIDLHEDHHEEVTSYYVPAPDDTQLENTGVAITGVTDGYDGVAPDRGAIISGRDVPLYGAYATASTSSAFDLTPALASPYGQYNPDSAFDGTDTYLTVWEEGRTVYGQSVSQIYAARSIVSGSDVTLPDPAGIHVSESSNPQDLPKIAYGGGVFLVVWRELDSSTHYDIKGAIIDEYGTVRTVATISNASYNQTDPDVVYDATNGNFIVVWADFRDNSQYQIYGARVQTDGTVTDSSGVAMYTLGGGSYVPTAPYTAWQPYHPVIGTNGTNLLVSWSENRVDGNVYQVPKAYMFDLDLTNGSRVYKLTDYTINFSDPIVGMGHTVQQDIASDGNDFLWLFRPMKGYTFGYPRPRYFAQAVLVEADGDMPNEEDQVDIDANRSAIASSAAYAGSNYWVIWEGLASSLSGYDEIPMEDDTNIYASRIPTTVTSVTDYSDPIEIAISSDAQHNPSVVAGVSGYLFVSYENDNLESGDDYRAAIKGRLYGYGGLDATGSMTMVAPGTPGAGSMTLGN
jgi:hypothetical protein